MRYWFLGSLSAVLVSICLAGCSAGQPTVRVCSGLTDRCVSGVLPSDGGRFRLAPLNAVSLSPSSRCHLVDVSNNNGAVDWAQVVRYVCGAVDKAGEADFYDSTFVSNWRAQVRVGLWRAAYWFVRPSVACSEQASLLVRVLREVGYRPGRLEGQPAADEEVRGANCAAQMDAAVFRAFHVHIVIYTAPGTWPGGFHGSLALWQAEYGPVLHPIWHPVVAWQCTDGTYGCVTYVPGLGYTDGSVDLGYAPSGHAPPHSKPKPKPHRVVCFGKGRSDSAACVRARRSVRRDRLELAAIRRHQRRLKCSFTRPRRTGCRYLATRAVVIQRSIRHLEEDA